MGGGTESGAFAEDPQPARGVTTAMQASTVRASIMATIFVAVGQGLP
jgi:hypothetical protein